jgi:hypothetical protein
VVGGSNPSGRAISRGFQQLSFIALSHTWSFVPSSTQMAKPLGNFLSDESLDFALRHVFHYYDSDFFPRTEEFIAIAHRWDDAKKRILSYS